MNSTEWYRILRKHTLHYAHSFIFSIFMNDQIGLFTMIIAWNWCLLSNISRSMIDDESVCFVPHSSSISVFQFEKRKLGPFELKRRVHQFGQMRNDIQLIFLFKLCIFYVLCMCVQIVLNICEIDMMDFILIWKQLGFFCYFDLIWLKIEQSGVSNCQSPSDVKSDFKQVLNSIYLDFYHNVMIHNILDVRIYRNCWRIFFCVNRITIETFATA